MADSATVKTSWADEVEVEELEPPKIEDYVDENGVRVTIEHTINDAGKKVKVRSRFWLWCIDGLPNTVPPILRLRGRSSVLCKNRWLITPWLRGNNGQSSDRKKVCVGCFLGIRILTRTVGNKPGPDRATTTVGEDVSLSLRAGGKVSD
jgi:translation initiation factor 3 subunit G